MSSRLVIIDTEPAVKKIYLDILRQEGFQVWTGETREEAMEAASREKADLIIADFHFSEQEGHAMCRLIRETLKLQTVPLLVISPDPTNGVLARFLNSGADACLSKPIDVADLLAHVRAMLRRQRISISGDVVIQKGRITLRRGERRVIFDNKDVLHLTPKEYELVSELILNAPRVVDRTGLVMKVWGIPLDQLGRQTVDVHMQRLRRKLGPVASSFLKTVSLIGYQWLENSKP